MAACFRPFVILGVVFVVFWTAPYIAPRGFRLPARLISLLFFVFLSTLTLLPMAIITVSIAGDALQAAVMRTSTTNTTSMTIDGSWLSGGDGGFGRLYENERFSSKTLHGLAGYEGVDVVGAETIHAPFDGTVIFQGCDTWSAAGRPGGTHPICGRAATWLEMESYDGQYRVILMHGDYLVQTGDKVYKGQPVGKQNCWGWCTGPHTHITVYNAAGQTVNYANLVEGGQTVVSGKKTAVSPSAPPKLGLIDMIAALFNINRGSMSGRPGDAPLRVSAYTPIINGQPVNDGWQCDADCEHMASGDKTRSWQGGKNGIYAAACPPEWPFGTRFKVFGNVYECRDRGGWIKTRNPGDFDPAMGGFTAKETYHWVDLLDSSPVPYGELVYDWEMIE